MDKKLLGLVVIFLLSFSLFTTIVVFEKPLLTRFTKAKEDFTPSSQKSLLFAWPLSLPADGQSEASINVFVRNDKEAPVTNKKVVLTTNLGTIKEIQPISNNQGKTEFKISSSEEGEANIKAMVENVTFNQTLSIQFSK
jgi:hypothetical protein